MPERWFREEWLCGKLRLQTLFLAREYGVMLPKSLTGVLQPLFLSFIKTQGIFHYSALCKHLEPHPHPDFSMRWFIYLFYKLDLCCPLFSHSLSLLDIPDSHYRLLFHCSWGSPFVVGQPSHRKVTALGKYVDLIWDKLKHSFSDSGGLTSHWSWKGAGSGLTPHFTDEEHGGQEGSASCLARPKGPEPPGLLFPLPWFSVNASK